jgi:RND family efflux transporter MFP subunit
MQESRYRARLWTLAVGLVTMGSVLLGAAEPTNSYVGLTKPSEERKLSFSYPGIVREVLVKKGDRVKAGQPLLRLDDRLDRNQLEQAKVEAESDLKIAYAKQSMDQKAVRYQRVQELAKTEAASPLELEEAQLNAELAATQYKLSHEEQQTAKLKAAGFAIKVDLATRDSTIDGIVQDIAIREGEYADPQQSSQRAAVVVVQTDPLKVEVYLPTPTAAKLKVGQELEVNYPSENAWQKAQIEFLDPVADSASGMRKLELKLPNPSGREPGWQVSVRVPGQQ